MRIADYLGRGQESAVPLRRLASLTGENPRAVRKGIETERRSGVPILSDNENGYWLAANEAEAQQFVKSMRGRAREILTTAAAVEAAYGAIHGE